MLEFEESDALRQRLMRSARILGAFYERKLNMGLELLTEAPMEPLQNGLQFDLQISRFGIWGLRTTAPISDKQQSEISAGFHGLLQAINGVEDRRQELVRSEEILKMNLREELPANVIPLRRAGLKARPFSSVNDKRWILRLDCLIESPQISEIHKMAFELHSQCHRYAFVEYRDLDRATRLNVSELMQLGAVSVFVPSILDLTRDEQRVLRQLMQQDTMQRPLLMVGANVPYADLRTDAAIDLEFLAMLSRAYIKLTRPFAEYKDQGLIHYFLDSLSQNPT